MDESCKKEKLGFWLYWKGHPELFWTIVIAMLSGVVFGTTLVNRVNAIDKKVEEQVEIRNEIFNELTKVNEKLNNEEYGLPVLNQRLKALERK